MKNENEIRRAIAHWQDVIDECSGPDDRDIFDCAKFTIEALTWVLGKSARMDQTLEEFQMLDEMN